MEKYIKNNLINIISNNVLLTYKERVELLRERKLELTQEKIKCEGGLDEDDYGRIVPPEDFKWNYNPNHQNGSFYGYDGWSENFYDLMGKHPLYVDPVDAFSGKWMFFLTRIKGPIWNPDYDYSDMQPLFDLYSIIDGIGYDAHFAPDYMIGLELGWEGILIKIDHYEEINGSRPFYDAERKTIKAIQKWIERTNELIKQLVSIETNVQLKNNLQDMWAVNEWIMNKPPRTLREACQWICWFNMATRTYNRDGAGGQLDELLRPYYEKDVEAGIIDDDTARFYFACLLLNDPHYYQLGGPDINGVDMTSQISYLILEAADMINSACNLTIRVHDGLDEKFFIKSIKYLFKNKNGWPRYSGDVALVDGFTKCGYSKELARKRIAVGCNWMSLPGLEYTMNDLVKINVAKVFEVAYYEMIDQGNDNYSTDILWKIFINHLYKAVEITCKGIDFHLRYQVKNEPELVLNLLSHGPIEKGLDVTEGGARYLNLAIDGSGIATVADSFAALQQRIETEQQISWLELTNIMQNNYEGMNGELTRQMMKNSDRYGQGNSLGDNWAVKISKIFTKYVREQNEKYIEKKYNFIPGWFSWANTIQLGEAVMATPNGRKNQEAINHGANPTPGFRKDGAVTAMINSIISIQPGYGNTAPIQLEFDPHLVNDEESAMKIAALVKVMFKKGATLLNINIVDKEKILEAHKEPEKYPDLVVRVTGFTAYFAMLSPKFRQLVVDRIIESN